MIELADGSTVEVDHRPAGHVLVARHVAGELVWGQAFHWSRYDALGQADDERPARELAALLDRMADDPQAFTRWQHLDRMSSGGLTTSGG